MSDLFPVPDKLERAEYSSLIFHLEAREYFDLPPFGLLRLRREFQQAIRTLTESGEDERGEQLKQLLDPPLPGDIQMRRLIQKPAPSFVLRPDPDHNGLVEPGDILTLPVLFLGAGVQVIELFTQLLQQVGRQGLAGGHGICELSSIEIEDGSGQRSILWNGGPIIGALTPVVSDLKWWLELQPLDWDTLRLDFVSPMRLLHAGKPLFKADFTEIFPFIMRRVTAMLAAHCNLETVKDPAPLIATVREIEDRANRLQWKDWRPLTAAQGGQDIGGLCGSMTLAGGGLADILWVLQLGSLLQVGKGAPYGAGCYQLSYASS